MHLDEKHSSSNHKSERTKPYVDQVNHLYMENMALNKDSLWVLISMYWLIGLILGEETIMVNQVKRLIFFTLHYDLSEPR